MADPKLPSLEDIKEISDYYEKFGIKQTVKTFDIHESTVYRYRSTYKKYLKTGEYNTILRKRGKGRTSKRDNEEIK